MMLNTVLTDSDLDLLSTEAGKLSTILHTDQLQQIASFGYVDLIMLNTVLTYSDLDLLSIEPLVIYLLATGGGGHCLPSCI